MQCDFLYIDHFGAMRLLTASLRLYSTDSWLHSPSSGIDSIMQIGYQVVPLAPS